MTVLAAFALFPNHGLLHIQEPGEPTFFEDWTEREIEQGFAWRPNGVSFKLLTDHGRVEVAVLSSERFVPTPGAVRAVRVPVELHSTGGIIVSDLFEDGAAAVLRGKYALHFETGYIDPSAPLNPSVLIIDTWCRFTFVEAPGCEAEVLTSERPFPLPLVLRHSQA